MKEKSNHERLTPNEGKRDHRGGGEEVCPLPDKDGVITENDNIADGPKGMQSPFCGKRYRSSRKKPSPVRETGHPPPDKAVRLARILTRFVYVALRDRTSMPRREWRCGNAEIRILFAAFISAIGKLLGKRGWFYKIAGYRAEPTTARLPIRFRLTTNAWFLGPWTPTGSPIPLQESVSGPDCGHKRPCGQGACNLRPCPGLGVHGGDTPGQPAGTKRPADPDGHHT